MPEPLPSALYRAEQVRRIDRTAIDEHAIPGIVLMERAAAAVLACMHRRWPQARCIHVAAGLGNNAGDGYLIAELAHLEGLEVHLYAVAEPGLLQGDAALAHQRMLAAGLAPEQFPAKICPRADLIIDALFGTGLNRPLTGAFAQAVGAINAAHVPVLAVDVPSGLDADTGAIQGCAVTADATVIFIALKQGLFTGQARAHCGAIEFDSLQVPPAAVERETVGAIRVSADDFADRLPPRPRTAHKGHFGHVLLVGGNQGYSGAIRLAACAALRSGAGLVSVLTHSGNVGVVCGAAPELMVRDGAEPGAVADLLAKASVVVIGPGLGTDGWAQELLLAVLNWRGPKVLDADALNLLATDALPNLSGKHVLGRDTVLTPHPAEAARLLGRTTADVEADRYAAVRALVAATGGVAVLKGAGTLIASLSQEWVSVCDQGNPGMASGGMGDVLSGIVGALRAQGLSATDAAQTGACVHAAAADAAAGQGERGLLASDVIGELRPLLNPPARKLRRETI
jgi:NAD(P)H-hydrate epimerase